MKTQWNKIAILTIALTGVLAPAALAQRQPPSREETREQRRERLEQMTPEQRQQYFQQRQQERLKGMTPEQRARWGARQAQMEEMRRQQQIASVSGEDRQRYLMSSAGIEDATIQDEIMAFAVEQSQKREPVTQAATQLSTLLADKATTPDALNTQLEKLGAASKDFRTWRESALKELDRKISYSGNARLKSLLVLVGIIGDESTDAGGFTAIFPKGLAGSGDIVDLLPKTEDNGFGGRGGGRGMGGGAGQNPQPADAAPATAN